MYIASNNLIKIGKYIHELAEDEGGGRISSRVNEDLKGTNEIFANTDVVG